MKNSLRFAPISFLTLLLAVSITSIPVSASSWQGSFQRTYQVSGPVDLEVLTHSGDITIRNGPVGTVSVSGKIQVEDRWLMGDRHTTISQIEQNPPIRQSGNSVRIDYVEAHGISVDYEITIPSGATIRTQTGSGDQRIEGLKGNFNLESGSGDVRLRDTTGEIRLHTGSGDVEADDISGPFHAETGSGDVRVDAKELTEAHIHTGSGNVELRHLKGSLEADSSSGDFTVDGSLLGAWHIRTSSGNIELQLPHDAAFDLDASAGSGEIKSSLPVVAVVQGRVGGSNQKITGKVNGGGPQLVVHTGSGDIRIG